MMQTMDTISGYYGKPRRPWLFAPSVSDFPFEAQYRLRTTAMFYPWGGTYSEFIPNLLGWLDNIGFRADDRWCWSYHTYDDIENGHNSGAEIRKRLQGLGWAGFQERGGPAVFSTEGGCRLNRVSSLTSQGQHVAASLSRAYNDTVGAGLGIGMAAQYGVFSGGNTDTGLIDSPTNTKRPVFDSWRAVPAS